jgi:hypothetical protein
MCFASHSTHDLTLCNEALTYKHALVALKCIQELTQSVVHRGDNISAVALHCMKDLTNSFVDWKDSP